MTRGHADRLSFRAWLVKQLLVMRWSAPPTATIEEVAHHLGVAVDVLEEVRVLRAEEDKKRGRAPLPGRKRALFRTDYTLVRAPMPKEIFRDWRQYCAALRITTSALLRSLVHHFLVAGGPRPKSISKGWHYRGAVLRITHSGFEDISARITLGAEQALNHYAELWGVNSMAIVRGLVTDVLEGRVTKLRIVAFSELWGDPERYLHPEKFTKA